MQARWRNALRTLGGLTLKKKISASALTVTLALAAAGTAWADEAKHGAAPGQGFRPSPGMMTMATLGKAGLIEALFSESTFGLQQARRGSARATVGNGNALGGAPVPDYEDADLAYVLPISLVAELPSWKGANFVRLGGALTAGDGIGANALDNEARVGRVMLQFLHAPRPDLLFGVGVVYDNSRIETIDNAAAFRGKVVTAREGFGFQALYAQDFAGPWAAMAKAEWQTGTQNLDYELGVAPGVQLEFEQNDQGDDQFYFEGQLVGSYTHDDISLVPQGWIGRPVLGVTYQHNSIEEVVNTLGATVSGPNGDAEDYGMVFARIGVERAMMPTPDLQFLPKLSAGLDLEYTNSLDTYIDEPVYGVVSAGLGITSHGQRLDLSYTLHQGLSGKRQQQSIVASTTINF